MLKGDYMVYLDYSATTKIDKEVMESFIKANEYSGNPNSLHKLGIEAKNLIDASTNQIIYTSGASESNNLAIKGLNKIKHIITTDLEHSSIYAPLNYLMDEGVDVSFVKLNNGLVDMNDLKNLIDDRKTLVTISAVNSETGVKQNIEEISALLKQYDNVIFHTDMTQAVGKVNINTENVDMFSFSAHKFFGIKGIGVLVKKENIKILVLSEMEFTTKEKPFLKSKYIKTIMEKEPASVNYFIEDDVPIIRASMTALPELKVVHVSTFIK